WEEGVTEEAWVALHTNGCLTQQEELLARVYLGGIAPQIRKEVWPYLLGHYNFGSSLEEREEQDRREELQQKEEELSDEDSGSKTPLPPAPPAHVSTSATLPPLATPPHTSTSTTPPLTHDIVMEEAAQVPQGPTTLQLSVVVTELARLSELITDYDKTPETQNSIFPWLTKLTDHYKGLYNTKIRQTYETTMSEWLAVEAIVRQRDKEIMALNMAKLSSESQNGEIPLVGRERSLSNEVFEPDTLSIGSVDNPGTVQEEDEDPTMDDLEQSDITSVDIDGENVTNTENNSHADTSHTQNKENLTTDESDNNKIYAKENLRQESKESDTAEVASPVSITVSC
ncbi:Small G protein signaling modulator 1-like 2, partial [Homarus americanus]